MTSLKHPHAKMPATSKAATTKPNIAPPPSTGELWPPEVESLGSTVDVAVCDEEVDGITETGLAVVVRTVVRSGDVVVVRTEEGVVAAEVGASVVAEVAEVTGAADVPVEAVAGTGDEIEEAAAADSDDVGSGAADVAETASAVVSTTSAGVVSTASELDIDLVVECTANRRASLPSTSESRAPINECRPKNRPSRGPYSVPQYGLCW